MVLYAAVLLYSTVEENLLNKVYSEILNIQSKIHVTFLPKGCQMAFL